MQKIYKKLFVLTIVLNFYIFNIWGRDCPKQEDMPEGYPYSEYCCKKCEDIVNDELLSVLEVKLREWSKYKIVCKKNGVYEGYIAQLYGIYHNYDKMIEILEESIKNPNYNIVDNASILGFFMYFKEDFQRLKEIAFSLVEKYPQYCNGYTLKGIYYMTEEKWDLAKENLEKAYELRFPHEEDVIKVYLSSVYYEYARYEDARKLYFEAYKKDPKNVLRQRRPTATMVASLVYLNRLDDAKKLMSEFEKKDPDLKNCEYYDTLQDLISEAEKEASKAP